MYDQLILQSSNNANAAGQRYWLIILLTPLVPQDEKLDFCYWK
jgi:hypothetical protein